MVKRSVAVAVFAGLAMVAGSQTLRSAPGVDIQALQEKWRSNLVAANLDVLEALYSDALVYVHSDSRIQTKAQFLGPMKAGTMRFASLTGCDEPRIRAFDSSAIVSACYELKAGTAPPSRHLFLTVWVNEGGQWRIIAQQTTRLPDKP
jgi:Domain of unknown function (DUF4440)